MRVMFLLTAVLFISLNSRNGITVLTAEVFENGTTTDTLSTLTPPLPPTPAPYPPGPTSREFRFESCSFDNIDACARAILFYGDRETYMAKNEVEMKGYCVELKGAVRCAADWSRKCLKGLPRQIMNVMLSGPAKNIKERCDSKGTAWYLRSFDCVKDSRPDIDSCMDTLKVDFQSIKRSPELDDWLPTGCCFFSKFMSCFDQNIRTFCQADGIKYLHWCRDAYLGDMVDLICPKESDHESGKCVNLMARIPQNETSTEIPRSVLLPVYQMFQAYEKTGRRDIPRPF